MSYEQLIAITQEAKLMRREDKERELVDCPLCGAILDENKDGVKNCGMGHFRAPAGTKANGG
jgi:uncharacterized C2H2 Zn-finger protein